MDEIDDGGPAFPWGEHGTRLGGLTMRDWFAGQALAGEMANSEAGVFSNTVTDAVLLKVARLHYRMADAMLAARAPTQPQDGDTYSQQDGASTPMTDPTSPRPRPMRSGINASGERL